MEIQIILAVVTACGTGIVSWLVYKLQRRESRLENFTAELEQKRQLRDEAINLALKALCRDRILQGYRYYSRNGGVSTQDLETMTKLYNAYHNLGGNGTISNVFEKIKHLPLKEGEP